MSVTLHSFTVRPPRAEETAAVAACFADSPLGSCGVTYLGAFGQPGDVPLGGVAFRELDTPNVAGFHVFVRPDCRRRSVGTSLVQHLYALARQQGIGRLELAGLVPQDSSENAFYRAMGMSVTRLLRSHVVPCERAAALCAPLLRRARNHPHLANTRIAAMSQVDLTAVAEFFAEHFGGFADQRLAELHGGKVDLNMSQACLADDVVVGGVLIRSHPSVASVMLDLILTAPAYRNGPLPLALIAAAEAAISASGIRECEFEGDDRLDPFAAGFARRAGARPTCCRCSYAVDMPAPAIPSRNQNGGVQQFGPPRGQTFYVPRATPV